MKKLLLPATAIVALSCSPLASAVDVKVLNIQSRPKFIDQRFTYSDRDQLFYIDEDFDEQNKTNSNKIGIYDGKFRKLKNVPIPEYAGVTEHTVSQNAIYGPTNIYQRNKYIYSIKEIPSIGDVEEYLDYNTEKWCKEEKSDGEIWYWAKNSYEFYYKEIYGDQYPTLVFIYSKETKELADTRIEYDYDEWGPTGKYYEPAERIHTYTPRLVELELYTEYSNDIDMQLVTQTLFNDDEAFEWVIPVYSLESVDIENEEIKIKGDRVVCTGYKVMSENGKAICEFSVPDGYHFYPSDYDDCLFLYVADGFFIGSYIYDEEGNEYFVMYEIDKSNNSVTRVSAPIKVRVSPTTPRKGEPVEVKLASPVSKESKVTVVSASGQVVGRNTIPAGEDTLTLSTTGLGSGLYIVNVETDGKKTEATKIIVR